MTESDNPDTYSTSIKNLCPECRAELLMKEIGNYNRWICPSAHGIAITVSEAWGHLQDDEIKQIWAAAQNAPASELPSPELGTPMVKVDIAVDDDEELNNAVPGAKVLTVYVAPNEQLLWFDGTDLDVMPADVENPQMAANMQAKLDELTKQFGEQFEAAERARTDTGRMSNAFADSAFGQALGKSVGNNYAEHIEKSGE